MRRRSAARRKWKSGLLLAVGVLPAAFFGCELAARAIPLRLFQDVLREFYVSTRLVFDRTRETCSAHGNAVFPKPGFAFKAGSPNLRYTYSMGSFRLGDCSHGYRLNGVGDEAPVHGIALGDSLTEAVRAADDEVWVSRLSRITGRRFLNFGWGGQGTTYHRRLADALVPALKPRAVILQICSNDADEDLPVMRGDHRNLEKSVWRRWLEWRALRDRSVLWYALGRWGLPAPQHVGTTAPDPLPSLAQRAVQQRNIQAIYERITSSGGRLAVVAFSNESYLIALDLPAWCARRGVPLLRGYKALEGLDRKHRGYLTDPHPNAMGNERIARFLANSLKQWDGLQGSPDRPEALMVKRP